jgi:hypothetical protein
MLVAAGATMSDIDGRDSQALSQPGFLIEVEVMAVIPERLRLARMRTKLSAVIPGRASARTRNPVMEKIPACLDSGFARFARAPE